MYNLKKAGMRSKTLASARKNYFGRYCCRRYLLCLHSLRQRS